MPISYADIIRSDVAVSAGEAAALVDAALGSLARSGASTLPSSEYIWLDENGTVDLRTRDDDTLIGQPVLSAATLLTMLLRFEDEASPRGAVPGALLVALARIRGRIDLPPPSLDELRRVLQRTADGASLADVYERASQHDAEASTPLYASEPAIPSAAVTSVSRPWAVAARQRQAWLVPLATFAAGVALTLTVTGLDWWRIGLLPTAPAVRTTVPRSAPSREPAMSSSTMPSSTSTTSKRPTVPPRRSSVSRRVTAVSGEVPVVSPLFPGTLQTDAFSPTYGADGELLFHVGRANGSLMKAAPRGGRQTTVTTLLEDGAANYHATLSPDGTRLAFDSDRDGVRGVYVAAADASAARRVSGAGYAAVPSWSPDGHRLAFVRAEPRRPSVWNVWVADLRTGSLRRISHHRVGQAWRPSWFPNGDRVAYSVEDQLIIVDLSDDTRRVVRSPLQGRIVRTPAVSPDGRRIVFQVYRDGIWLMDVTSGAMRRLLPDRTAEEFAWAPDGDRVAYHARRGSRWSLWQLSL